MKIPDIRTERLHIRPYREEDFNAWQQLLSQMNPRINQWDWEPENITDLTLERYNKKLKNHEIERKEDKVYYLCVEQVELKELIGITIIDHIQSKDVRSGEIGFQVNNRFWGSGYGTEIALATVSIGFDQLGLSMIEAKVNKENFASNRIMQKIGMKKVGENETQYIHSMGKEDLVGGVQLAGT